MAEHTGDVYLRIVEAGLVLGMLIASCGLWR